MSDEWVSFYDDGQWSMDAKGRSGFSSAAGYSTAPYKSKAKRTRDPRLCAGNDNTCKGFHTKDSEFCSGHNKSAAKAAVAA